jgi:predicted nucleotidyltransferase
MDQKLYEKLNRYAQEARKLLPVERIILFGSYARGSEKETSDIDVAVVASAAPAGYLKTSAQLFKLSRSIDSLIEPKLVLLSSQSGFLESIEKYGIVVFDAKKSA